MDPLNQFMQLVENMKLTDRQRSDLTKMAVRVNQAAYEKGHEDGYKEGQQQGMPDVHPQAGSWK